jgi:non-ribosomal peptide synthase protein (TIGR01720 family)
MILFDPTRVFSLLGPDQDGPVSAAEWAHDDAVAAMVRNRAIAAGRTVTLTSAQDSARTLLAARSDLLPSGARIRWEPAARPSGLDEADPAARYAAVIGASTAAPDRWVVLDPDPEVCAKTSMALPRAAAVLVPAGAAGVRRALEHAWLLDGDPAAGPWPGTSNATDVQVRILDEGLCDAAAVHAAAIRGRRAAAGQPYAPPRNERETILADVWADLLGHERVGIHDDFFALGGDSMTAIQVVSQAARQGIAVSPRQVLEAKTVAELAAAQAPVVVAAEQGQITGPVPLSAAQRWFFDQPAARMEYPTLFNHPYYLTVATGIDAGTLSAALRFLVDHHDGLRARFTRTAAGQWTQQTEPCGVPVPFESVDLSGLEPADREARAVEAAAAAQAGLDLSAGPLVRALHMSFGGAERDRLLIVNHHLVVDAVSRGVILEDLATVSAQLTAGEQPRLPAKTTSYRAWSSGLASYADSAELRAELPFWLSQVAAAGDAGIPIDYPDGVASFDAARTASVDLGEDLTAALHRFAGRELHSGLSDLIVGVTALELAEWTGRRDCRLALAGHGREDVVPGISLSRTVGWFQIYYPLLLTVPEAADLGVLRSVRSQLSAVPRNGIGHSVLRYLCTDEAVRADLAAGHQPQVSFNYMGDFGFEDTSRHTDLFGACTRPYGPTEDGQGVWPYLMDIVPGMVGRSLRIDVNYSENVHRRATAEGLAKRITDRLTRLVR